MKNQFFEELANLYGIEIQYNSKGNGGLYYVDPNDRLRKVDTILNDDFVTAHKETINIERCCSFDMFNAAETNISEAA